MTSPLAELARIADAMAALDAARADLIGERADAIAAARAEGVTWTDIARAAGLSLRAAYDAAHRRP